MYLYLQLPAAARRLARIPRFGRLIARMAKDPDRRKRLSTESSVLWELYAHVSSDRNETGLVDSGLDAIEAGRLGLNSEELTDGQVRTFRKNANNRKWQRTLAMDLWGAIAFRMFCGKDANGKSPPLDRITADVDDFMNRIGFEFEESLLYHDNIGPYRSHQNKALPGTWINTDIECLRNLNSQGMNHVVLTDDRQQVSFCDITTQAFFAAFWACRWATDEQLAMTQLWIPNPYDDGNSRYREFWRMVIDLPGEAALPRREALLSPLYDGTLRDEKDRPIRSSELICESWELMRGTEAQRKFLQEFKDILAGSKGRPNRLVAMELLSDVEGTQGDQGSSHFLSLASERCGEKDNGHFDMGEPAVEDPELDWGDNPIHAVQLSPYRLHRFCVTNAQYELYDVRHLELREFVDEFKRASDLDRHPVVNVSSWDGLCFGLWVGEQEICGTQCRITLPTEAQFEYACRCGEQTPFTWGVDKFGVRPDGNRIESGYCNFNGNNPWQLKGTDQAKPGPFLGRTIGVDSAGETEIKVLKNPWGFWQLHGNVLEWCRDWYDSSFYGTEGASQVDPENRAVATFRVLRGGSWFFYGWSCRSASRNWHTPGNRNAGSSFRLAAVPVEPSQAVK